MAEGGIRFDQYEIEAVTISEEAMSFGNAPFECPKKDKKSAGEHLGYYRLNDKLMIPCDKCYKSIIFWHDKKKGINHYNSENLQNLEKFVNNLDLDRFHAKINNNAVFFYFKERADAESFLTFLSVQMKNYGIQGVLDWQRACGMYWRLKPQLWKGYKEFLGVE